MLLYLSLIKVKFLWYTSASSLIRKDLITEDLRLSFHTLLQNNSPISLLKWSASTKFCIQILIKTVMFVYQFYVRSGNQSMNYTTWYWDWSICLNQSQLQTLKTPSIKTQLSWWTKTSLNLTRLFNRQLKESLTLVGNLTTLSTSPRNDLDITNYESVNIWIDAYWQIGQFWHHYYHISSIKIVIYY